MPEKMHSPEDAEGSSDIEEEETLGDRLGEDAFDLDALNALRTLSGENGEKKSREDIERAIATFREWIKKLREIMHESNPTFKEPQWTEEHPDPWPGHDILEKARQDKDQALISKLKEEHDEYYERAQGEYNRKRKEQDIVTDYSKFENPSTVIADMTNHMMCFQEFMPIDELANSPRITCRGLKEIELALDYLEKSQNT